MFEPEELMARIVDLEAQLKVSEMAPPAAEQLIACLEGEIAKRDEELAACRVAVENCELFRSRIVELEITVFQLNNSVTSHHWENTALRAELAAIKAQEPVAWISKDGTYAEASTKSTVYGSHTLPLYAAPVPVENAQVVMPERWNVPRPMWKDARQPFGNPLNHADIEAAEKFNLALDEVARLNAIEYAAPVSEAKVQGVVLLSRDAIREVFMRNGFTVKEGQADLKPYVYAAAEELLQLAAPAEQVSVPQCVFDWFEAKQAHVNAVDAYNARLAFVREHMPFGTSVDPEYQIMEAADSKVRSLVGPMFIGLRGLAAAAPAAPAADAWLVEALGYQVLFDAIAAATRVYANGSINISVQAFRESLAAHRAKGVV